MSTRTVTSQAELDQAIADKVDLISINSPAGVWLTIRDLGSSSAELWGSSRAVLRGSSRAVLRESSSAVLRESSSAELRESSRAVLRESSSAELWGSSSAELWGSSSAVLRGSSRAVLRGSSRAELWESSRAELWESSSVHAYNKTRVTATPLCAVFLHSSTVDVAGGVILDHSNVDAMDGLAWCEYHGVKVSRGIATVYKAVDKAWTTDRGTNYFPGTKPSCDDFCDTNACGNGLHFSPTPRHAKSYFETATKFVAVGVRVAELRPITGSTAKCKVPRVVRACVEVDIDGNPVAAEKSA